MARILGIELPANKKILFALPYFYGIGRSLSEKILKEVAINPDKIVKELTEDEISKLQKAVENYPVEGDLRRQIQQNITRLQAIGVYRGIRHKKNLPVRGQRTRSNARTKRGKRVTIGAIKKDLLLKMQPKTPEEKGNKNG